MAKDTKQTATTAWDHKGVTISLRENGTFFAKHQGQSLNAPSLARMREKIDAATKFEPFDGYVEERGWQGKRHKDRAIAFAEIGDWSRYLLPVKIVNFDRANARFIDDQGSGHTSVMRATPEVLQAWRDLQDVERRKQEREDQFKAEADEAQARIVEVSSKTYALTGKI